MEHAAVIRTNVVGTSRVARRNIHDGELCFKISMCQGALHTWDLMKMHEVEGAQRIWMGRIW
jgi:hypothetical protein